MKRLLLSLFLATAPLCLCAQGYEAVEVAVSTEKANVEGTVYYLHKVLPRQTVYSICKAYGLTQQELAAANPEIKDGLKAGAILLIPTSAAVYRGTETAVEESPAPAGQRVIEHRVRWYESLTSIARKYGITPAEIWAYNDLRESDNIRGRVLLIPVPEPDAARVMADEPDVISPDPAQEGEGIPEEETPVRKPRRFTKQEPLRLALVLPLDAGGNASAPFLNFYSGALMALQEQKEKGACVAVSVFDLAKGAEAILSDPEFRQCDLIIGPVETATIRPFLRYSDESGTLLVSPLDHKADSLVNGHPGFFQAPVPAVTQIRNLAASIASGRGNGRVVLVCSHATGETVLTTQMEEALQEHGISYRKASLAELGGLVSGSTQSDPVRILIGSENQSFCADVIRTLNGLAKKNVPMEVWCTNRVRNYETSDPDALFNLSVHTAVPYFVDYSDADVRQFVLRYRALFGAEPDDFAYQGHDLLTFFTAAMMQQGTDFAEKAGQVSMQLLHCDFRFVRKDAESGWRNCATRHLFYDKTTYSIVLTK